jgi:transcriptional regulator with XRE-family HTH domain
VGRRAIIGCTFDRLRSRYTDPMADEGGDAGTVRAGIAFAARRQEIGISQRELARDKIITAANLIKFEKGRAWPREKTRARLEQVVQWPPGELARLRAGKKASESGAIGTGEPQSDAIGVVTAAVTVAIAQVMNAADNLPDSQDSTFDERVRGVLADLRALETVVTRAVRSTQGAPEVLRSLKTVRDRYGQLMTLAASAPSATLGQRLYTARTAAALSASEAADAMNLTPDVVAAAESEQFVSDENRQRIAKFIAELAGE